MYVLSTGTPETSPKKSGGWIAGLERSFFVDEIAFNLTKE